MDTFKLVGRHLFGLIILWAVLYFVANFSVTQSVVLTLLAHYVVVRFWQIACLIPNCLLTLQSQPVHRVENFVQNFFVTASPAS